MHNLASASVASLHQGVAALSATVGSLQGRLAATLAQFDDVRREVQELEGLVVDEVGGRRGALWHCVGGACGANCSCEVRSTQQAV